MKHYWNWLAAITLVAAAIPAQAQIQSALVAGGTVAGTAEDGLSVFKGIPFAAPPVGELRWKGPQPVRRWHGVRSAAAFAPSCMQDMDMLKIFGGPEDISEDCLYLNVWTPATSPRQRLPVMVWIYGGGFAFGATNLPLYDGKNLAQRGVVLVSIAYRVGPLGFMAHPALTLEGRGSSGNYGLADQIAGLKWVRANIARFGGDPANVTIFGESAGGISVSMLAASPAAKGLFQKAISESGGNFGPVRVSETDGGLNMRSLSSTEAQGSALLQELGAADIKAARALSAAAIQKLAGPMGRYWPTVDGRLIAGDQYGLYQARRFNDTPVLMGSNSDEGSLFMPPKVTPDEFVAAIRAGYAQKADAVLAAYPHATEAEARQAMANVFRETAFAWPTWTWSRFQARQGKGAVYVYYFDHKTPRDPNGSNHGDEMRFVFGNHVQPFEPANPRDQELTAQFMGYWTNFAKTGDPNGPGLPEWPRFTSANAEVMALGDRTGAMAQPNLAPLQVFDDYYAWRRELAERK
jgi:para-nitrobenzyl esterase